MTSARRRNARKPVEDDVVDNRQSLIEEVEATPHGAREMAAARLALTVRLALQDAFTQSGRSAKDLAAELGVGESAVSQVLSSDGNLRVGTIARYARALGHQAFLALGPPSIPVAEAARAAGLVASHRHLVWHALATSDDSSRPPAGASAIAVNAAPESRVDLAWAQSDAIETPLISVRKAADNQRLALAA